MSGFIIILEFLDSLGFYDASVGTPPDARPVLGLGVVCEADIPLKCVATKRKCEMLIAAEPQRLATPGPRG